MKLIIKLFPEIHIKSKLVKSFFIKKLVNNIKKILKKYIINIQLLRFWDRIEILLNNNINCNFICNLLIKIPGIQYVLIVEEYNFLNINDIIYIIYKSYIQLLQNKTFCVRVKRNGIHNFTSLDVERKIGDFLIKKINSATVKLVNPDITIKIEIRNNIFFLVKSQLSGLGGFPIGTQGEILSLISGGFDSSVSSYMLIKRGCRVHYCFFNLGGFEHEIKVKQIAYYLWNRFGSSHEVYFFSIDFSKVITELFKVISSYYINIVLKRMMFRVASKIMGSYGIQGIVTGESIGQVSSQTLKNLDLINGSISSLILRPLISYNKEDIISIAHNIGTKDLSVNIQEYCGLVLKKSATKANLDDINNQEMNFDFNILDEVINKAHIINISNVAFDIVEQNEITNYLKIVNNYNENEIIIDIRTPEEQEKFPMDVNDIEVKKIPFYKLNNEFIKLAKNKTYLLYCEQGIMSRLQASYLISKGFKNIKIYIPKNI